MKYVTITLYVADDPFDPQGVNADDAVEYLQLHMADGPPVVVSSWAAAYKVLRALGLDAEEARHRINFARTGDMYATRTAARRRRTALDRA